MKIVCHTCAILFISCLPILCRSFAILKMGIGSWIENFKQSWCPPGWYYEHGAGTDGGGGRFPRLQDCNRASARPVQTILDLFSTVPGKVHFSKLITTDDKKGDKSMRLDRTFFRSPVFLSNIARVWNCPDITIYNTIFCWVGRGGRSKRVGGRGDCSGQGGHGGPSAMLMDIPVGHGLKVLIIPKF